MARYLQFIGGSLENSGTPLNIPLSGKSLIITGANGSGKTHFIKQIYQKLQSDIAERFANSTTELKAKLERIIATPQQPNQIIPFDAQIVTLALEERNKHPNPHLEKAEEFVTRWHAREAIIVFFEANRTAQIFATDSAKGVEIEKARHQNQMERHGTNLEQHLVNLRNQRALVSTEQNDQAQAASITQWFLHFENSLKILLEDDSTKLIFNIGAQNFSITQDNKPTISFQSLSSGYSSILDIYGELIMKSEYFSITQHELSGIIFIDEIDAHLHVSLQRLILPFLERAFPQLQFIVTTHSPFVLTSVNDAVIFDLTDQQVITEDISFYTYSAVMSGILGVKPTSLLLDQTIQEVAELSNRRDSDINRLKTLLNRVEPSKDLLDSKSKAFYQKGINVVLDREQDNVQGM